MSTSDNVKRYRARLTEYVKELRDRSDDAWLEDLAKLRKMPVEVFKDAGIFYIKDQVDMLLPEFIDEVRNFGVIAVNGRPIYNERYVIPIYDMDGYVQGMVGYKYGVQDRYMYATCRYFNRGDAVYNRGCFAKCIHDGYAVIVEGIMDALRVKSFGIENVLATCGADKSWDRMLMFSSIKRCVFIPDRDRAGHLTKSHWNSETQLRILLPKPFKDIDEFASQNDMSADYCKETIENAIEYLLESMPQGRREEVNLDKVIGT